MGDRKTEPIGTVFLITYPELRLIETGEFNMTQISYMVGINDPRYFSKCFKVQVGMTPTEYRDRVGR